MGMYKNCTYGDSGIYQVEGEVLQEQSSDVKYNAQNE